MTKSSMRITHQLEVAKPLQVVVIPIAVTDWRRIKARLGDCARPAPPYGSIVSTLVGMSASAAISAISIHFSADPPPVAALVVCWFLAALTGGVAAAAYVFSRYHHRERKERVEWVVDELEVIESRYELEGLAAEDGCPV